MPILSIMCFNLAGVLVISMSNATVRGYNEHPQIIREDDLHSERCPAGVDTGMCLMNIHWYSKRYSAT